MSKPLVARKRKTSDVIDSLGDNITFSDLPLPKVQRSDSGYSSSYPSPFKTDESLVNDDTDAFIFQYNQTEESESNQTLDDRNAGTTVAPVRRLCHEYNMNHPRRGIGIIFNHENFKNNPTRLGTGNDVLRLENMYKLLCVETRVYNDKTYSEIMDIMEKLSRENHSDHDCLIVTILTHGMGSNCLYASDAGYHLNDLCELVSANHCKTLAGKPKIFFIQACRGANLDHGENMTFQTQADSGSDSYKIPKMADFFIAQSTFEGYYSFRNPETGSWFIQSLVDVFEEYHSSLDLSSIMIEVTSKVAVEYESYHDKLPKLNGLKEIPCTTSTLLRKVFFTPKKQL